MTIPSSNEISRHSQSEEDREAKLAALRQTIDAAIKRGGSHTEAEVRAAVKRRLAQITAER